MSNSLQVEEGNMTVIADRVIASDSFSNLSPYTILRIDAIHKRVEHLVLNSVSRIDRNRSQGHVTSLIKSRSNNGAGNKN